MRKLNSFLKIHSSTILTYAGAIGLIATSVATAMATIKACDILDKAKEEKCSDLTRSEMTSIVVKAYIPPILIGAFSISCIFGSNILSKRQQKSLVSAYALIAASYSEYKAKVKELYGEKMHQEVVDAIVKENSNEGRIYSEQAPTNCNLGLEEDSIEPRLFYDEYSSRYFEATIEQVILAEYNLNRIYVLRGYAVLNEFYDFLGLESTDYGSIIGWSAFDSDGVQWLEFNHHKIIINDDLECYAIEIPLKSAINTCHIMKLYRKGV